MIAFLFSPLGKVALALVALGLAVVAFLAWLGAHTRAAVEADRAVTAAAVQEATINGLKAAAREDARIQSSDRTRVTATNAITQRFTHAPAPESCPAPASLAVVGDELRRRHAAGPRLPVAP